MQGADRLAVLDVAIADLTAAVGAQIAHGEDIVSVSHDRKLGAVDMPDDTPAGLDVIEAADHRPTTRHMTLPHRNPMPATPLPLDVRHPGPPVADGRFVSPVARALHEVPTGAV
jgi:hypothetical protein